MDEKTNLVQQVARLTAALESARQEMSAKLADLERRLSQVECKDRFIGYRPFRPT